MDEMTSLSGVEGDALSPDRAELMEQVRKLLDAAEAEEAGEDASGYNDLLRRVNKALVEAVDVKVPVSEIRPCPFQPRDYFDPAHIAGLAMSIGAAGQTTPGMIRRKAGNSPYELIDGECRLLAIQTIPQERRPLYRASLIDAGDDVVQFLLSGVANFNRHGHTALEVMRTVEMYLRFGLPMPKIAKLLGLSKDWTEDMYNLRKLVPEVKALIDPKKTKIKKDRLAITAAIQISKADQRFHVGLAQKVLSGELRQAVLRDEIIAVSKEAGAPLRTRTVTPDKRRRSLVNKVELIMKLSTDVLAFSKDAEILRNLRPRRGDVTQILDQMAAIHKVLTDAQVTFDRIRMQQQN